MDTPTQTGKVLIRLRIGVDVCITPLSFYVRRQLQEQTQKRYPFPDAKTYEQDTPKVEAFGGGELPTVPASENPAYIAACAAVKQCQDDALNEAVFNLCVSFPSKAKDDLLAAYANDIAALREQVELPHDNWYAIFRCFLTSVEEFGAIYSAIGQSLPLAQEEIIDAYAYFRFPVSRHDLRAIVAK